MNYRRPMLHFSSLFIVVCLLLLVGCRPESEQATATVSLPAAMGVLPTPTLRPTGTGAASPLAATAVTPLSPTPLQPAPTLAPPTTATAIPLPTATAAPEDVRFAVIGDYGLAGPGEATVAALIHSWQPTLIITVGDNNYPNGEAATIDQNIGQYYADYIYPYQGIYTPSPPLAERNRFFPTLGNHDYDNPSGIEPYLDYFTLPGNERYYEFEWGPVHFFALNSDWREPDGIGSESTQAAWLQEQMATSTLPWQVVYFHAAPYSSGLHGSTVALRWPYSEWGADAVIAAHDHHYERLLVNGIPYFINGLGGGAIYQLHEPLPESQFRFTGEHGVMLVEATTTQMIFEFVDDDGELIDRYVLEQPLTQID